MTILSLIITCLFGLVLGSFITVLVDRIPAGRSIVRPGSACDSCGAQLKAIDLIPMISWVTLGGRCRYCDSKVNPSMLAIEGLTASVFVYLAWVFGVNIMLVGYLIFAVGMLALAWIDYRTMLLPHSIIYSTLALTTGWFSVVAIIENRPMDIVDLFIGAVIYFAIILLIFLVSRGGMGSGDVRLALPIGVVAASVELIIVPIALVMGFLFGSVIGIVLIATGRADRKTPVPFGPFMIAGAFVAIGPVGMWTADVILHR